MLPFFATGTMERVERLGEVATAAALAHLLSAIPSCAEGPVQIVVLDIHALQERFYFADNVIVHLKSCIRLLIDELAELSAEERRGLCIVFPDDGAWKRFHSKFEGRFPLVVCNKIRGEGATRLVQVREGREHVLGAHCVIVDDLVRSGNTLIECALVLHNAGGRLVSAFATHGVFPGDSWTRFLHDSPTPVKFHRFWITNSIPTKAGAVQGKEPFRVLSIAPVLAAQMDEKMGFDDGRYD